MRKLDVRFKDDPLFIHGSWISLVSNIHISIVASAGREIYFYTSSLGGACFWVTIQLQLLTEKTGGFYRVYGKM